MYYTEKNSTPAHPVEFLRAYVAPGSSTLTLASPVCNLRTPDLQPWPSISQEPM